ncbi:MAG: hypothetical protein KY396_08460, partial [Actinobacteria bacterium]|nr:hypothetical protein [Actinomycetota bacterium]
LLEAGVEIAEIIADPIEHPHNVLQNMMRALKVAGRTLGQIVGAAWSLAEDTFEEVVKTALEIGEAIVDILDAALQVAGGAVATVVSILLRMLASYRPMTPQESADAKIVFGNSLDYGSIYFASESLLNDIIFGIQDFFSGNPESRAFVTNTLVNFDVDEGIERHTMIHELTHVWQFEVTGPFYMSEAIHAQVGGAGYNYGYVENGGTVTIPVDYAGTEKEIGAGSSTGLGAEDELNAAAGNFGAFNREQQGQILMHYFVRRVLLNRPASDYAPWQPYVDVVRAA